jgi:hypothetical protein
MHQAVLVRALPERRHRGAHQQKLCRRHVLVRRHFQRAEFHQSEPVGGGFARVQLVDAELSAVCVAGHVGEQMAENAIDQPGRDFLLRCDLRERDLQFDQAVLARLVNPRMLAGGPFEQPAEQVRQARMVVPETQQRFQQIGTPQEWTVGGFGSAHHHVVAAACADDR